MDNTNIQKYKASGIQSSIPESLCLQKELLNENYKGSIVQVVVEPPAELATEEDQIYNDVQVVETDELNQMRPCKTEEDNDDLVSLRKRFTQFKT